MIIPTLTVVSLLLLVQSVYSNPCTNGELIESAGIQCSASQIIKLFQAKTIETKCGIVLDNIRPCVLKIVAKDHNATCTEKEKHELILEFRDTIKNHLQFDVIQCLPVMSCTDFESVMYYLQVSCETEFLSFVNMSTCSNLCDLASCHVSALKVENKMCSVSEFQRTIRSNPIAWATETDTTFTDMCCSNMSDDAKTNGVSSIVAILSILASSLLVI